jgi:hypothetical protein
MMSEAEAIEWTWRMAKSHHESGHVVAGCCVGFIASSLSIEDEDHGGSTVIDFAGDAQSEAIVALAGIIAHEKYDQRFPTLGSHWFDIREGMCSYDVEIAMAAIRVFTESQDLEALKTSFADCSVKAGDILSGKGVARLVDSVAVELCAYGRLDVEGLAKILHAGT